MQLSQSVEGDEPGFVGESEMYSTQKELDDYGGFRGSM